MEALLENDFVSAEDLKKFERKYYEQQQSGSVNSSTMFEYAWALIRSRFPAEIQRGAIILEDLCYHGDEQARRDYLFYLAIANTKLGDYQRAMDCINKFLLNEPANRQASELRKIIKDRMTKEGLKGMAIVGGAAALVVGGLVGLGIALTKK